MSQFEAEATNATHLGIVAAIVLLASVGKAQNNASALHSLSANFILQACKEAPTESQQLIGNCWGQIQALYLLAHMNALSTEQKFCPPQRVSIRDAKNIVVKYIEARDLMYSPFIFSAIDALKSAWPCR